ncbi:MAG: hypothetical protein R2769_14600 [Saprospiraceae bacterium]
MRIPKLTILLLSVLACLQFASAQNQTIDNNEVCLDPIVAGGTFINPVNTGLCLACSAADGANAVDGDLDNYADLDVDGSPWWGTAISVKDSVQYYPAGNRVGFVIEPEGGLLSATVLGGLQIRTYRNGYCRGDFCYIRGLAFCYFALKWWWKIHVRGFVTSNDFDSSTFCK